MITKKTTTLFQQFYRFSGQLMGSCVWALWYLYKGCFAPFLAPSCRFYPSCSEYARESLARNGLKALPRIVWRLLRCNPWGGQGYDPVK